MTVYTANFGKYDAVPEPFGCFPHTEHLLYTDNVADVLGWKQAVCQARLTLVREARKRKCLSHIYADTEFSIWHDGNIRLLTSPSAMVEMLGDMDLLAFAHPYRDCAYDEAGACIELGKADAEILAAQTTRYIAEGFPTHNGLCETGLLVRRHSEAIIRFNEMWWAEIEAGSHRDQASFNYVAWKTGARIKVLSGGLKRSPYLEYSGRHDG
uniref:TOD1/MUCI70 glycosyltransferase-like domain-containing protein n=1 Tax=viral metagenome TaxID=1070528 RepID=A0A6M3IT97_9ZZZZ